MDQREFAYGRRGRAEFLARFEMREGLLVAAGSAAVPPAPERYAGLGRSESRRIVVGFGLRQWAALGGVVGTIEGNGHFRHRRRLRGRERGSLRTVAAIIETIARPARSL